MVNFEEEILKKSFHIPVVVDFWADWCEPCSWLEPILDALAIENKTKWNLVKIDIDVQPQIAVENRVKSVPTTIIFIDGKEVNRYKGMMFKKEFGKWIEDGITSKFPN
ncbi:MAG: thioredoxin domain-containing protein [Bacteroidetes bacterium]|nr:thioredoxin domain-containing protein [Bacteroidota bacterium]